MNPSAAPLLRFYRGQGRDASGRSFDDVMRLDLASLEHTHDYIQWLFPLFTRSAFVADAPLLDADTVEAMRADPVVRANLLRALRRMLDFYGLSLDDDDPGAIVVETAPQFATRSRDWMTAGNHNLRRITRILTSLRLLGLAPHAQALFECLDALYRAHGARIGATTFGYWRDAVRD